MQEEIRFRRNTESFNAPLVLMIPNYIMFTESMQNFHSTGGICVALSGEPSNAKMLLAMSVSTIYLNELAMISPMFDKHSSIRGIPRIA